VARESFVDSMNPEDPLGPLASVGPLGSPGHVCPAGPKSAGRRFWNRGYHDSADPPTAILWPLWHMAGPKALTPGC